MITKLALSGAFLAGKDWVASNAGFRQLSVAEPMYRITEYFFGYCDKKRDDVRNFLQTIGQWGWGYNDPAESPCSPERAAFTEIMRTQGAKITGMKGNWENFGKEVDFWIRMLISRLEDEQPHDRLAVTNLRFPHEQKPLLEAGFEQYLVLCTEETRQERNNGTPIPAHLSGNVSERFAAQLAKTLPEHRIIWNDHRPMPADMKYLTVGKFKELANS